MCLKIIAVNVQADEIAGAEVGLVTPDGDSELTCYLQKDSLIALISAGWAVEVERPVGNRVRVVVRLRGGKPYVCTTADDTATNNLLEMPRCDAFELPWWQTLLFACAILGVAPRDMPELVAVRFPGGPQVYDLVASRDGSYTAAHDTPGPPYVPEADLLICAREGLEDTLNVSVSAPSLGLDRHRLEQLAPEVIAAGDGFVGWAYADEPEHDPSPYVFRRWLRIFPPPLARRARDLRTDIATTGRCRRCGGTSAPLVVHIVARSDTSPPMPGSTGHKPPESIRDYRTGAFEEVRPTAATPKASHDGKGTLTIEPVAGSATLHDVRIRVVEKGQTREYALIRFAVRDSIGGATFGPTPVETDSERAVILTGATGSSPDADQLTRYAFKFLRLGAYQPVFNEIQCTRTIHGQGNAVTVVPPVAWVSPDSQIGIVRDAYRPGVARFRVVDLAHPERGEIRMTEAPVTSQADPPGIAATIVKKGEKTFSVVYRIGTEANRTQDLPED